MKTEVVALIRGEPRRKDSMLRGRDMQSPCGSQMVGDKTMESQSRWGRENEGTWCKMSLAENAECHDPYSGQRKDLLFTQILNNQISPLTFEKAALTTLWTKGLNINICPYLHEKSM